MLWLLCRKNLEKAHLDTIGCSISLPSKITSIPKPDQVLIGEFVYHILKSSGALGVCNNLFIKSINC